MVLYITPILLVKGLIQELEVTSPEREFKHLSPTFTFKTCFQNHQGQLCKGERAVDKRAGARDRRMRQ